MAIIEEDNEEEDDKYHHQQLQSSSPPPQSLPTETVIEILLKLPVKSLLRFKTVSKSWFSLVAEPHFVKSHLSLSAHERMIFRLGYGWILNTCCLNDVMNDNLVNNALEIDYPFKRATESVRVVGSCNGLVCLRICNTNYPYDDILVLWNPSTRIYHKLPLYGYTTNVSRKLFGFGYDDSSDDYKVVSVYRKWNEEGSFETFVKMYSLRNESWKDIGAFPHSIKRDTGKFVNGALHWVVQNSNDHWKIISLDLATETFGEVMEPVYDEGKKKLRLETLGEWLCVLCDYCEVCVDLWVMKVYGVKDSWTKFVSLPYMPDHSLGDHYLVPLCISDYGRILFTFGKKIMIYDSKNNSLSDIQKFDKHVYASTFVESLVSPMLAIGHRATSSSG